MTMMDPDDGSHDPDASSHHTPVADPPTDDEDDFSRSHGSRISRALEDSVGSNEKENGHDGRGRRGKGRHGHDEDDDARTELASLSTMDTHTFRRLRDDRRKQTTAPAPSSRKQASPSKKKGKDSKAIATPRQHNHDKMMTPGPGGIVPSTTPKHHNRELIPTKHHHSNNDGRTNSSRRRHHRSTAHTTATKQQQHEEESQSYHSSRDLDRDEESSTRGASTITSASNSSYHSRYCDDSIPRHHHRSSSHYPSGTTASSGSLTPTYSNLRGRRTSSNHKSKSNTSIISSRLPWKTSALFGLGLILMIKMGVIELKLEKNQLQFLRGGEEVDRFNYMALPKAQVADGGGSDGGIMGDNSRALEDDEDLYEDGDKAGGGEARDAEDAMNALLQEDEKGDTAEGVEGGIEYSKAMPPADGGLAGTGGSDGMGAADTNAVVDGVMGQDDVGGASQQEGQQGFQLPPPSDMVASNIPSSSDAQQPAFNIISSDELLAPNTVPGASASDASVAAVAAAAAAYHEKDPSSEKYFLQEVGKLMQRMNDNSVAPQMNDVDEDDAFVPQGEAQQQTLQQHYPSREQPHPQQYSGQEQMLQQQQQVQQPLVEQDSFQEGQQQQQLHQPAQQLSYQEYEQQLQLGNTQLSASPPLQQQTYEQNIAQTQQQQTNLDQVNPGFSTQQQLQTPQQQQPGADFSAQQQYLQTQQQQPAGAMAQDSLDQLPNLAQPQQDQPMVNQQLSQDQQSQQHPQEQGQQFYSAGGQPQTAEGVGTTNTLAGQQATDAAGLAQAQQHATFGEEQARLQVTVEAEAEQARQQASAEAEAAELRAKEEEVARQQTVEAEAAAKRERLEEMQQQLLAQQAQLQQQQAQQLQTQQQPYEQQQVPAAGTTSVIIGEQAQQKVQQDVFVPGGSLIAGVDGDENIVNANVLGDDAQSAAPAVDNTIQGGAIQGTNADIEHGPRDDTAVAPETAAGEGELDDGNGIDFLSEDPLHNDSRNFGLTKEVPSELYTPEEKKSLANLEGQQSDSPEDDGSEKLVTDGEGNSDMELNEEDNDGANQDENDSEAKQIEQRDRTRNRRKNGSTNPNHPNFRNGKNDDSEGAIYTDGITNDNPRLWGVKE